MARHLKRGSAAAPTSGTTGIVMGMVGSLLAVSLMVTGASRAAWNATTTNSGNSFGTGSIVLTDDDGSSALFAAGGLFPGDTVVDCIEVTYGSDDDPDAVKLFLSAITDGDSLAQYLDLTIEEGSGGSFGDCTGFTSSATIESGADLADFATNHTSYATGVGTWDPSGNGQTQVYRFTVTLDASAPSSAQGATVSGVEFTWETSVP